jgi:hypothetical protein
VAEVAQHHAMWTRGLASQLATVSNLMALYDFGAASGQELPDLSPHGHHLLIPPSFRPLHAEFLVAPWKDMSYDAPNYRDIVVNCLGFVPFGFCFYFHRRCSGANRWFTDAMIVVLAGIGISLTIETLQVWLPNRVSSMTDLLANAAGTLVGVILALALRPRVAAANSK